MAKLQSGTQVFGNLIVNTNVTTGGGIYTTTGLFWAANNNVISSGGGGSAPGGLSGQVQYNSGGILGAASIYYFSGNGTITFGNINAATNSTTTSSVGTSPVALDSFSSTSYRSAKYVISVSDTVNSQYQTSDLVLVQDGTTATISSYGLVYSGASARMTFTANISAGTVTVWGTGVSTNNNVKLVKTLIPV